MDFAGDGDWVSAVRASRFMECRFGGLLAFLSTGEVWLECMNMSTICGLPTQMKLTTLAVSSCDFLLDLREKDSCAAPSLVPSKSGLVVPEKSCKESVSS